MGEIFEKNKASYGVSLARYTTWKVGGCAKQLFRPSSIEELRQFIRSLPEDEPIIFLGLGSNSLIRSGGLNATVIVTTGLRDFSMGSEGSLSVCAQSGVACAKLARSTAREGLSNLEFLAGIPGTLGGALAMNAGCHGAEVWNFVESVVTIDRQGNLNKKSPYDFNVGYRYSSPSTEEWFISASLSTTLSSKEACQVKIKTLLQHREDTQPINLPNGGCAFRNPKNDYAGRLIEECGLKGYSIGGAEVSVKHANFIVNKDKATSEDIELLVQYVEATVLEQTGVKLIRELKILGDPTRM